MISSINTSLSGLLAQQKKVDATAHNVANVETDGFKKSRVTLNEGENDGVSASVTQIDTPGPMVLEQTGGGEEMVEKSNVELTEEIPDLVVARRSYQANLKVIQTQDEMIGSLLDIKG